MTGSSPLSAPTAPRTPGSRSSLRHDRLGRRLGAFTAFEIGNLAATLLILRATDLLTPVHGAQVATALALGHCLAATALSRTA